MKSVGWRFSVLIRRLAGSGLPGAEDVIAGRAISAHSAAATQTIQKTD
jgi:hypothetical protein